MSNVTYNSAAVTYSDAAVTYAGVRSPEIAQGGSVTVTIDHTKVEEALTDFPLYVDLADMPPAFWSVVSDGGGDIRCYKEDGITELPREVVDCDTVTSTGQLHVKTDLSSTTDTIIVIQVDGTSTAHAATSTYGKHAVWTNGFAGVWHMDANPPADNWLTNPGAENNLTGWTAELGAMRAVTVDQLAPYAGTKFFVAGADAETILYQDVDLLGVGYTTTELDAGVAIGLDWYQSNSYVSDTGQVIMQFLDSAGTVLDTVSTPVHETTPTGTWVAQHLDNTTGAGAVTVRVKMRVLLIAGSNANVCFDGFALAEYDPEASFSYDFSDSTANENTASDTTETITSVNKREGVVGSAFQNSSLTVADDSSLDFAGTTMTISAWIRPSPLSKKQSIVDKADGSTSGYRLIVSDSSASKLKLIIGSLFNDGIDSNAILTADTWNHIAVVYDAPTATFYNDGAAAGSGNPHYSNLANTNDLQIMTKGYSGSSNGNFTGAIDELHISSSARTAGWLATEYANQSAASAFYAAAAVESSTQDEADGSASTVTAAATGAGNAVEAASDGSATSVGVSVTGAGIASTTAHDGSASAVNVTATGSGNASETPASGASTSVNATATGAGISSESVHGGSPATVTVTTVGGGSSAEVQSASGGASTNVSITSIGDGVGAEHVVDGAAAITTATATGAGTSTEHNTGGSATTVTVTSTGGGATESHQDSSGGAAVPVGVTSSGAGIAAEFVTNGSASTITVTATGTGLTSEAAHGGDATTVTITSTGGGSTAQVQSASGGSAASIGITSTGTGEGSELVESGSVATVTATAIGIGAAIEYNHGGAPTTVTVTTSGAGSSEDLQNAAGGANATVTITAYGTGAPAEQSSGGATSVISVHTVGVGQGLEYASGGSDTTIIVTATGATAPIVTAADRTLTVAYEPRNHIVTFDNRTAAIPNEPRTLEVT